MSAFSKTEKIIVVCSNIGLYFTFHHIYRKLRPSFFRTKQNYITKPKEVYKTCKQINLYSLSSFNYTLMGILLYKYKLNNNFFRCYYPPFMCAQGIISYLSDSLYVGEPHWSHNIDISFAAYNSIGLVLLLQFYTLNYIEKSIFTIGFLIKKLDAYYYRNNIINKYKFCHILWHTILPGLSAHIVYSRRYIQQ